MTTADGLRIELVAPDDPATLEEWFAPLSAADKANWPDDPSWFFHERVALLDQPGLQSHVLGVARLGPALAGSFQLRMPLKENLDSADIEVWVDPSWRGRGVGRMLLGCAEAAARDRSRTLLSGTSEAPLGSPTVGHQDRFAKAAGYELALEEVRRTLLLPLEGGWLEALETEARERSAGYRLVEWAGPTPREWETSRSELARGMSTDAPQGELESEPEEWDVERLRHFEGVTEAMGRDTIAAGALDAQGALVGFTQIGIPRATGVVAYQFDTIVLPAHRGHRLGLLLKVANLRKLQAEFPATQRVVTFNAAANEPMIRVNEQLGFRLSGTGNVWQKRLA